MKRIIVSVNNLLLKSRTSLRTQQPKMPYYAVAAGREVGIFDTWAICEEKVKGFRNPKYKKFKTLHEAETYLKTHGIDVKSKAQTFDPRNSAVPVSNKDPAQNSTMCKTEEKTEEIVENWPDEFECSEADNDLLLSAMAEVEGISESKNRKRPLNEVVDSEKASKYKKYSHDSIVWEPIGLKKIGNFEFPIDSEGYVIVYTDGSCINNGRTNAIAGYGVYFSEDHPLNAAMPVKGRVTNNAGEIQAAIHAVQVAKDLDIKKLCISTDSQFLINAATSWIKAWKRRGWKLADGKPVKNADDFSTLDELLDGSIDVKWNYVKGHKGIEGNEKADQLARSGASKYEQEKAKGKK